MSDKGGYQPRRLTVPRGRKSPTTGGQVPSDDEIREILAQAEAASRHHYFDDGAPGPSWPLEAVKKPDTPFTEAEVAQFQLLIQERARRHKEALRLYTPLPFQAAFHRSDAPERSVRGSNRSGKTLSAAVEFARAVTGQDPYQKYPKSGRAIVVGKDEKHCGEVLYRKLFKPGAFKVIRDEHTRKWRAYNPKTDERRRKERKNSPPLIPARFYTEKDISWSKKREEIPKKVVLNAGTEYEWEIYFFSSLGEAPQGWDVDIVWFDEEIEHPSWYVEMAARLIDRSEYAEDQGRWIGGKFIWSATPQAGTIRLFQIHNKARECVGHPQPNVTEHVATLFDNDYLSDRSKQAFVDKLGDNEDEARVRIYGEFALLGMRIYSDFMPHGVHGMESFDIPDDWCRYISIDPGRQICAVLFAAVPPPRHEWHDNVFLYDELYIHKCDAERFAELLSLKISHTPIQEAIIDNRAGRQTEMGSGKTVEEQYKAALVKRGVRFGNTNSVNFTWGSDDVEARILAVRSGLKIKNGRSSRWIVFRDKCKNFIKETELYSYKKNTQFGVVTDQPLKLNDHLMDDWGYMAAHGLQYKRPRSTVKRPGGYAVQYIQSKKIRKQSSSGYGNSIKVG